MPKSWFDAGFRKTAIDFACRQADAGGVVKQVVLYRCSHQTRPFPFDNKHENMALYFAEIGDRAAERDMRELYGEPLEQRTASSPRDDRARVEKR